MWKFNKHVHLWLISFVQHWLAIAIENVFLYAHKIDQHKYTLERIYSSKRSKSNSDLFPKACLSPACICMRACIWLSSANTDLFSFTYLHQDPILSHLIVKMLGNEGLKRILILLATVSTWWLFWVVKLKIVLDASDGCNVNSFLVYNLIVFQHSDDICVNISWQPTRTREILLLCPEILD